MKPDFDRVKSRNIYRTKNSGEPAVHLEYAAEGTFVDYSMKFFDDI